MKHFYFPIQSKLANFARSQVAPTSGTRTLEVENWIDSHSCRIGAISLASVSSLRPTLLSQSGGVLKISLLDGAAVAMRIPSYWSSDLGFVYEPDGSISNCEKWCRGVPSRSTSRIVVAHDHTSLTDRLSANCIGAGGLVRTRKGHEGRDLKIGIQTGAQTSEYRLMCGSAAGTLPNECTNDVYNKASRATALSPSNLRLVRRQIISKCDLTRKASVNVLMSTEHRTVKPWHYVLPATSGSGSLPPCWRQAAPDKAVTSPPMLYALASGFRHRFCACKCRCDEVTTARWTVRCPILSCSGQKLGKLERSPATDRWAVCRYLEKKWISRMGSVTSPRSLGGEPSRLEGGEA